MGTTPRARQLSDHMMASLGFVLLVLNAADYLFSWNQLGAWLVAVGLMLVVIGAGLARSARSQR